MSPSLQNARILVRPHEVRDIDALYVAIRESMAEVSRWLPWCHAAISMEEVAAFVEFSRAGWADKSQYQFVICDALSGMPIGGISLNHLARPNRLANMGYWVRTSATGRGVASQAVKLVAAFGFQELGLTRIEIAAIPENVASCSVARSVGAKLEGLARNRLVMHGKAYDANLYSLIPGDIVG
jgi:ribosomal-protein-serine acetyltransferase